MALFGHTILSDLLVVLVVMYASALFVLSGLEMLSFSLRVLSVKSSPNLFMSTYNASCQYQ